MSDALFGIPRGLILMLYAKQRAFISTDGHNRMLKTECTWFILIPT